MILHHRDLRRVLPAAAVCLLAATGAHAQLNTRLSAETNQAFETYVATVAPAAIQKAKESGPLPWLGSDTIAKVRKGETVIRRMTGDGGHPVKNGIVHDWLAGIFVPGATLDKVTAVTQDFARHKDWYPEIIESKLVSRNSQATQGEWLLKKKKVITVVLRAALDSRLYPIGPKHAYLISQTKPILEVADYGKAQQKDYPAGEGHGFLWRFNGYWTFHEADGGVYVECRVISLSRDVPSGLGWIVNPFIKSMPRESLESTLKNTRDAVLKGRG